MPKTLRATVEIDVDDLTPETMDLIRQGVCDGELDDVPLLKDTSAREAASALEGITEHTSAELFAGTDIYVRFLECRVLSAKWKTSSSIK